MEKKSLLIGTMSGMLVGSLLAGSIVFASTSLVQAQKKTVNYGGIQGTGLVYGGTTYAELYAVQQVLKQQGIVNHWTGSAFTMDSPSQSNSELASQNQQLTQQVNSLSGVFKNLAKLPQSQQQQILTKLSQAASSSQSSTVLQNVAQGLQQAISNTNGNSGIANSVLQNLLNGETGPGLAGAKGKSSSTSSGTTSSSGSQFSSGTSTTSGSTSTTTTTNTTSSFNTGNSTSSSSTP